MKAKFQNRLASNRCDLGEIAPLGTPFVLIVDPASHCNFKCRFCPTGDLELIKTTGRYQGPMAFDMFTKIIDDLQEFTEPVRVLRLYKEGEPLMNKRFAEMVRYARGSDKIDRIDTTTNGVLLTPKTSEKVIEAGINQINISVNGVSNEHFADLVRTKVNFGKYIENIRYLYSIRGSCEIYVKAIKENLSEDEQKRFWIFSAISPIACFLSIYFLIGRDSRMILFRKSAPSAFTERCRGEIGLPIYFLQHDH
jgi:MoaA/NifB/PqqE/SkfB family radical SAM enzyme